MPIYEENGLFRLDTENSSYWLKVSPFGHLEHIHFGAKLAEGDPAPLELKRSLPYGSAVLYSEADPSYCLDNICLEWSAPGKGDYRNSPCEIKMPDGSFVADFDAVGSARREELLQRLDETADALRDRFGEDIIRRAKFATCADGHMMGGLDKARRTGVTKPVPKECKDL